MTSSAERTSAELGQQSSVSHQAGRDARAPASGIAWQLLQRLPSWCPRAHSLQQRPWLQCPQGLLCIMAPNRVYESAPRHGQAACTRSVALKNEYRQADGSLAAQALLRSSFSCSIFVCSSLPRASVYDRHLRFGHVLVPVCVAELFHSFLFLLFFGGKKRMDTMPLPAVCFGAWFCGSAASLISKTMFQETVKGKLFDKPLTQG